MIKIFALCLLFSLPLISAENQNEKYNLSLGYEYNNPNPNKYLINLDIVGSLEKIGNNTFLNGNLGYKIGLGDLNDIHIFYVNPGLQFGGFSEKPHELFFGFNLGPTIQFAKDTKADMGFVSDLFIGFRYEKMTIKINSIYQNSVLMPNTNFIRFSLGYNF